MSRPQFPTGTILPVSCIRAVNEEQRYYDEDPERYERQEREREEIRQMDEQRMMEEERAFYERIQEEEE